MVPYLADIPELETERLRLRAPSASDYEPFVAFRMSERSRGVGGPEDKYVVQQGISSRSEHRSQCLLPSVLVSVAHQDRRLFLADSVGRRLGMGKQFTGTFMPLGDSVTLEDGRLHGSDSH